MDNDIPRLDPETIREHIRERHRTSRAFIYCLFGTVSLAIIVYAIVRLGDQPPWVSLAFAVFGPTGSVIVAFVLYLRYLSYRIKRINDSIDAQVDEESPQ